MGRLVCQRTFRTGRARVRTHALEFKLRSTGVEHVELGTDDWFVVVRLVVNNDNALLTLEDGNGGIRARQEIGYTDFPLAEQISYAVWDGEHWVLMLPSEY